MIISSYETCWTSVNTCCVGVQQWWYLIRWFVPHHQRWFEPVLSVFNCINDASPISSVHRLRRGDVTCGQLVLIGSFTYCRKCRFLMCFRFWTGSPLLPVALMGTRRFWDKFDDMGDYFDIVVIKSGYSCCVEMVTLWRWFFVRMISFVGFRSRI